MYNTDRMKMSVELKRLVTKLKRERKIDIPPLRKEKLRQLAAVSKEIEEGDIPRRFVLQKLPKKLGKGIFLHGGAKPIPKGTVIASYAGEVIVAAQNQGENSDYVFALISDIVLSREEQKLFAPSDKFHPRRLYSLDLDAGKVGNFTRFINHSEKPNVEAHFVRVDPNPCEIVYVASKTIRPGEQLLVCYEGDDKTYWGALKIKPFPMTPQTFKSRP